MKIIIITCTKAINRLRSTAKITAKPLVGMGRDIKNFNERLKRTVGGTSVANTPVSGALPAFDVESGGGGSSSSKGKKKAVIDDDACDEEPAVSSPSGGGESASSGDGESASSAKPAKPTSLLAPCTRIVICSPLIIFYLFFFPFY